MAANNPYLSVIIPVRNGASYLPLTLVDIDRHLSSRKYTYEVLVVDNGSTDGTLDIAQAFTKMISNLRVLEIGLGYGIGGALRFGIMEASGKYKVFMEADNSTSIEHFNKSVPLLRGGADVVIGSRSLKDSKMIPPKSILRRVIDGLGSIFLQLFLIWGIRDSQCGFKCFSSESADRLFRLQRTKGWAFNVEILALTKKLGFKIEEIPVDWINYSGSRGGTLGYLMMLIEISKIRWWIWRDSYGIKLK